MKKFITVILPVIIWSNCFSQNTYSISAGRTYESDICNCECPGYYASVDTHGKLNEYFGFSGSLVLVNHKIERDNLNSILGVFSYNYYPFKSGLKFLLGMNIGAQIRDDDNGVMAFHVGIGIEEGRFMLIGKYNEPVSDGYGFTMLGISYKISR